MDMSTTRTVGTIRWDWIVPKTKKLNSYIMGKVLMLSLLKKQIRYLRKPFLMQKEQKGQVLIA